MSINLPPAVASYFAGDLSGFSPDASVHDESATHQGLEAIRRWSLQARENYQHTTEPLRVRTVVTARVTGAFPGSPLDLEHVFELEGERITRLEIH